MIDHIQIIEDKFEVFYEKCNNNIQQNKTPSFGIKGSNNELWENIS